MKILIFFFSLLLHIKAFTQGTFQSCWIVSDSINNYFLDQIPNLGPLEFYIKVVFFEPNMIKKVKMVNKKDLKSYYKNKYNVSNTAQEDSIRKSISEDKLYAISDTIFIHGANVDELLLAKLKALPMQQVIEKNFTQQGYLKSEYYYSHFGTLLCYLFDNRIIALVNAPNPKITDRYLNMLRNNKCFINN